MDTQPTNQTPQPVMQTEPVSEGTPPDLKKSALAPVMLLGALAILIVFGASYYLIFMKKPVGTTLTETRGENAANQSSDSAMILEEEQADLDAGTPPLTTTDTDSNIETDLNNTTVADDSSLYTELEAGLQGL